MRIRTFVKSIETLLLGVVAFFGLLFSDFDGIRHAGHGAWAREMTRATLVRDAHYSSSHPAGNTAPLVRGQEQSRKRSAPNAGLQHRAKVRWLQYHRIGHAWLSTTWRPPRHAFSPHFPRPILVPRTNNADWTLKGTDEPELYPIRSPITRTWLDNGRKQNTKLKLGRRQIPLGRPPKPSIFELSLQ